MASFLQRSTVQHFLIRFFVVFFAIELLLAYFPPVAYQTWLAESVGSVVHVPANGIFLSVNGIQFEISAFCTGLTSWGLLVGLLVGFTYPPWLKKIKYAALGLVGILMVNFFRLILIVYVGMATHLTMVDVLHTMTWFVMSALVVGVWYWMLCRHVKTRDSKKVAEFLLRNKNKF